MGSGRVYILHRRPNPAAPRAHRAARPTEGAVPPITAPARRRGARQSERSWWAGPKKRGGVEWQEGAQSERRRGQRQPIRAEHVRATAEEALARSNPGSAHAHRDPVTHVARPRPDRAGCTNVRRCSCPARAGPRCAEALPGATAAVRPHRGLGPAPPRSSTASGGDT